MSTQGLREAESGGEDRLVAVPAGRQYEYICSFWSAPRTRPQCAIRTDISASRRTRRVNPPKIHSRSRLWP